MVYGRTQLMPRPVDTEHSVMRIMMPHEHREGVKTRSSAAHSGTNEKPESVPSCSTKSKLIRQPPKPRRKWKKPKDKPKRPLSAYNLYFKEERDRIINEQERESSSTISFRDMAQLIASKWNSLTSQERSSYDQEAMKEKGKYFVELSKWKKLKKVESIKVINEMQQADAKRIDTKKSKTNKTGESLPPKTQMILEDKEKNQKHHSAPLSQVPSLYGTNDYDEPLPIEHLDDMSSDLGDVFSSCENSFMEEDPHASSKKSAASLIDALQNTLENLQPEDSSPSSPSHFRHTVHSEESLPLRDYGQRRHYQACASVTKRVRSSLDTIRADKDFVEFMGALDWK